MNEPIAYVWRCAQGHITVRTYCEDDEDKECGHDGCNAPTDALNDPTALLAAAEKENREFGHRALDLAMLERMRQLDPAFAAECERIRDGHGGFWYA